MPKLNDTQLILLSAAALREDRSFYPLPDTLSARANAAKAIAVLVDKGGGAEERETIDAASVHRSDGDIRYGVFATDAGLAAIGIGEALGGRPPLRTPRGRPRPPPSLPSSNARRAQRSPN